jgi:hypothetical protein
VIGQYYNFQGILHTANMMNTMTNMFMVFKMINIYWFVSNSNEMVRQHIDKYTNVRHNMQVMTGLVCFPRDKWLTRQMSNLIYE